MNIVYAQECYYNSKNSPCEIAYQSLNDFKLEDLSSNPFFDRYEVSIYDKANPANKLKFEFKNLDINQITPFLESGVYVVEVKAFDKSQNKNEKLFYFNYDTTNPLPPVIPLNLNSISNTINFEVKTQEKSTLHVLNSVGNEILSQKIGDNGKINLTLPLQTGNNLIKFYIENENNFKSEVVERIIQIGTIDLNTNPIVSSISIDSNLETYNSNTIKSSNYITTKRNFYIQGVVGTPGSVVFVNGIRTIADQNGKYSTFVLLNEGDNEIIAKSGGFDSNKVNVKYSEIRFQFLNENIAKIVSTPSISFNVNTNIDYPFDIFLNGIFIQTQNPVNNIASITLNNLKQGKNFIELRGINNQKISKIIYYDTKAPIAIQISNSESKDLVFEIEEDIGIDLNSVQLIFDSQKFEKEDLKIKNDFFIFPLNSISDGEHPYTFSGKDLTGKTFTLSGSINLNSQNTLIKQIFSENGDVLIGNYIFLKQGKNQLNIVPSRNIAFKSIYLDNIDQIDYEIFKSDVIKLSIEPKQKQGKLKLTYINTNYEQSDLILDYFVVEDSVVELDYILNSKSVDTVLVTGEINQKYIDFSSLSFNSQKNVFRYGKYFEALVELKNNGQNNLIISGNDFSSQSFNFNYGGLLFKDTTSSEIIIDESVKLISNSLKGTIGKDDENIGNYNFINSYDGYNLGTSYLSSDNFNLPLIQREGFRAINLKGFEASKKRVSAINVINVNSTSIDEIYYSSILNPQIYFAGNDKYTIQKKYFIQGNILSSSKPTSVKVRGQNCQFDSSSFVCLVDLVVGENTLEVEVKDSVGTTKSSFMITRIGSDIENNPDLKVTLDKIYGQYILNTNPQRLIDGSSFDLDGSVTKSSLIKVLVGSKQVMANKKDSSFTLSVNLKDEISASEKAEFEIQLVAEDEFGNKAYSNKIKLIYSRIVETLAKVVVRNN